MTTGLADALARLPLLAETPRAVVDALARHAVERAFAPGEVLFLAGSAPRGLHVVLEGRVRVVRARAGSDRQHVIHTEGPGGTLGEVPLFAGGTYPATAVAAEPTRCAVLSREALHAAVAAEPTVAFVLLERLAGRVRGLVARLDGLASRSATARLAAYVLDRPADRTGRGVSLGMTQGALAEELGTVREIVVRGLRALVRRGALRPLGGGRFEIVSREALERAAEEG